MLTLKRKFVPYISYRRSKNEVLRLRARYNFEYTQSFNYPYTQTYNYPVTTSNRKGVWRATNFAKCSRSNYTA